MLFGWAILSYQFISNGIIAALVALAGPVTPIDAAGLCVAVGHHGDAVPRLRARLLVQPLAQPQGAAAVGIPQSAPHRGSAHAAHQFPRPSDLRLDLRQHPRLLDGRRQRPRQLHVRRYRLSIRAVRHQHNSGAVHPRLCPPAAYAYVDFVPRRARARFRFAGAPSSASLGRSETLQQELRLVPSAVGLDVRHALYSGEAARAAGVRRHGSPECAHGEGRAGGPVRQSRRPSQAGAAQARAGRRTQASSEFTGPGGRAPRPRAAILCAFHRRPPRSCRRRSNAPARPR